MIPSIDAVLTIKPIDTGAALDKAATLCAAVDAFLRRKLGRNPEAASYTHRVDGNSTRILYLPAWPILSVTSVEVDGSAWTCLADADEEAGQQYRIGRGGLWLEARSPYWWPEGSGNVKAVYSAGYDEDSMGDLHTAGALIVHLLRNEEERIGEGQMTLGDVNVQQVIRNSRDYQFITDTLHHFTWRPV